MMDEDAIMTIFNLVDAQLSAGLFVEVEFGLAAVDIEATSTVVLLAWLSITHAAKEHLPGRAAFAQAVKAKLERDEPERAEELLRGLV